MLASLLINAALLAALPLTCNSFSSQGISRLSSARGCRQGHYDRINPANQGMHQQFHHQRQSLSSPPSVPLFMLTKSADLDHRWARPLSLSPNSQLFLSIKPADTQPSRNENNDHDSVHVAIDKFISTLQASLDDGSFESFSMKGPSAPRKKRKSKASNNADADALLEQQKEKLRGKYKSISGRLILLEEKKQKRNKSRGMKKEAPGNEISNAGGRLCVQTTIKYHLATDVAKNWRVEERPNSNEETEVEEGLRQLFMTAMGDNSSIDKNDSAPLSEWGARNMNGGILSGELVTFDGVYKLSLQQKASFQLSKDKPTRKNSKDASQKAINWSNLSHDRSKNVPLSPTSKFFQELGVSNADGKPMNGMASKLRQCQKFVEIVGNLVENAGSTNSPSKIRVIDMGCGRGYLTFSLHSYLSNKLALDAMSVETQGIDIRPKLVNEINGIAQGLGGEFASLNFVEGAIGRTDNTLFGDSENNNSLDILIALHACDTATDDALWFAIERDADVIVTAPCCQHELRPQIDKHTRDHPNHPLSDILKHAIYRERATETVSDAMRAILLEIAGYETQVFEFIGGEHTAKNVMITAIKVKKERDEKWLQGKRQRLRDLAQLYGVQRQKLASLMGESIVLEAEDEKLKTVARNRSGMAPI